MLRWFFSDGLTYFYIGTIVLRDDQSMDTRMLSLLHVLHDKEGFLQEVQRLIESESIDDESWKEICEMSRDLGLEGLLLYPQANINRCGRVLRPVKPRRYSERRLWDRRTVILPWLGADMRKGERRQ